MATVHPVTLYIRPAGPGDEGPLSQLAPDLADVITPIVRREASGLVFVITAVDEPAPPDAPDRSLGHGTPSWGAPSWDAPGWDEPSWTTSPARDAGLADALPSYGEDRAVVQMERRASVVPQVVGLVRATAEGGRLTVAERRLATGFDVQAVSDRIEGHLGRFASAHRLVYAPDAGGGPTAKRQAP